MSTGDVMYNMINIINSAFIHYIMCESCWESGSWEFSSQGKNFFSISLILYLYEMTDVHWTYDDLFMIYVSQTTVLYILNLYSAI